MSIRRRRVSVTALAWCLLAAAAACAEKEGDMKDVSAMLPAKPVGLGRPRGDRAAWEALAGLDDFRKIVDEAGKLAQEPIPEQPDDLFLEYSRNGNRVRWEKAEWKRRARLRTFALAECLESKGRFIKPLEEIIEALCREKTWVMPAHDGSLANFQGRAVDVDLASAALAWEMATAAWLFGNDLPSATRERLVENVRKRVLIPFMDMVEGRRKRNWWMDTNNNWNAVCLAGVVGAALAIVESPGERAEFIRAAGEYSKNFLRGFGSDGYCSEGLGYWNYGFGHYVMMAETIIQATAGKINLMNRDDVRLPAAFGARIEIINRLYPAFADCAVGAIPAPELMGYLNRTFGMGPLENTGPSTGAPLFNWLLYSFPDSASGAHQAGQGANVPEPEARTLFDASGIMICRPGHAKACRLGVAIKGGNNNEHHNHNDIGSFVVAIGKATPLLDPGAEVYTARTFGPQRYESQLLNSFGHPVPVVAGALQDTGAQALGKILRTEFTDDADTLLLDIKPAYGSVGELKNLIRTFVYSRRGAGALTVTDEVEFSAPKTFGTALITLGDWKEQRHGRLLVSDQGETLLVDIKVEGTEFDIKAEEIKADARTPRRPTRIGINLRTQVKRAVVTLTITRD